MKKINLILTGMMLLLLAAVNLNSQVSLQWAKRYNFTGTLNDYTQAMTYDESGNVYVTGYSNSNYITLKYSPEGNILWTAIYNGPANDGDEPSSICVDAAGNVYVTGSSFGNGSQTDMATIKYNASGTQQWVQRYNGTGNDNDEAVSVAVDAAGNVYTGGWATGSGGSLDYVIVKYSSAGSQVWSRTYNGPASGNDIMTRMIIDNSGNIYATGRSRGALNDDVATIKYNASGILVWSARYDAGNVEKGTSLVVDGTGSVIVSGTGTTASTGKDYLTIRYNNAGIQQWAKNYNRITTSDDEAAGIVSDASGNVYVTGSCTGIGTSSQDYVTISYNTNGDQRWSRVFTGGLVGMDDIAASIDIDSSGNIYVTGSAISSGSDFDFGTAKYSASGSVIWSVLYEGALSADDRAVMVKADNAGNIYIAGNSTGLSGIDFMTVKYSQPIGITPISTEVPEGFGLGQNYPNPFNPMTNVKIQMPNSGFVKLTVFDVSGKEVAVLVNENLNAGTYNVDFDASNLASGTYFYRMVVVGGNTNNGVNGFTAVKKMVVVK